jgi:NAD(P)H-hydrate repair Nnr-like enzyme with NAD(P)H-hydrate dehydratase domain
MQTVTEIAKLPTRESDSHKGTFGKVCVIGGQTGMAGAPSLTATAALKSGAGLVRAAIPKSILSTVASFNPCYTTIPLAEKKLGKL